MPLVGRGTAPHPRTHPPRSEQDPAAWWSAFEAAWQRAGAPDVAAISVAGEQHGMVVLERGGARSAACRQILADLIGRALVVPVATEQVAAGACVQAAAVLAGTEPADIADAWDLDAGDVVEPGPAASAATDVRAAYAAVRG